MAWAMKAVPSHEASLIDQIVPQLVLTTGDGEHDTPNLVEAQLRESCQTKKVTYLAECTLHGNQACPPLKPRSLAQPPVLFLCTVQE